MVVGNKVPRATAVPAQIRILSLASVTVMYSGNTVFTHCKVYLSSSLKN